MEVNAVGGFGRVEWVNAVGGVVITITIINIIKNASSHHHWRPCPHSCSGCIRVLCH